MRKNYNIELSIEEHLPDDNIIIRCQSPNTGAEIMNQLEPLNKNESSMVIKQDDSYIIVKKTDIIFVEVYQKELTVYTTEDEHTTSGTLASLYEDLPKQTFVQVSKSSLINIHRIKKVEPSFSGNLLAHLSNGMKVSISRRYVTLLKEALGI